MNQIVLVVPKNELERCQHNIVDRYGLDKVTEIVAGGEERIDSVKEGLKAVDPAMEFIAVHDGGAASD